MRGHFTEAGDLRLVGIAVEALIIFVGQPCQPARVEKFLCGAIGEIDRAPLVVVKEARDPVDRARGARDEARLLNEQVVIAIRSEEHTSELQSIMRNSYADFCLIKKIHKLHSHAAHTSDNYI